MEKNIINGTITKVSNRISSKGQAYSIFRITTLEGKEIDLFKFDNNLNLLNRLCQFEIESTTKNDKEYLTIKNLEVDKKWRLYIY